MIQQILLGNTDISVSRIGLGTVKFGRNQNIHYPYAFSLPTDKEIINLLNCARDLGINLIDTAPAYGTSEERLGKLLRTQRAEWILSTKVGEIFSDGVSTFDFSASAIKKSVENSLKRLGTDYLDILLVHSNGEDEKIIQQDEVFITLEALKKSGYIRAYGMSTKTIQGGMLAANYSDVVMVTYNLVHAEEQPIIHYAKQKNVGIFIKKALASGHLEKFQSDNPVRMAIEFVFQQTGVSSMIVGTLNTAHLEYIAECVS